MLRVEFLSKADAFVDSVHDLLQGKLDIIACIRIVMRELGSLIARKDQTHVHNVVRAKELSQAFLDVCRRSGMMGSFEEFQASAEPKYVVLKARGASLRVVEMPTELKNVSEYGNRCMAVSAIVALVVERAATSGRRLVIQSRSLGMCEVASAQVVAGLYAVRSGSMMNPLIFINNAPDMPGHDSRFPLMQSLTMVPEAIRVRYDGTRFYWHAWMRLSVVRESGEPIELSLDPTARQFGAEKDIVVFHAQGPSAAHVELAACGDRDAIRMRLAQQMQHILTGLTPDVVSNESDLYFDVDEGVAKFSMAHAEFPSAR